MLYRTVLAPFPECDPPELVYPDSKWLDEATNNILCKECRFINRAIYPYPVDIVLENPPEEGVPCAPVETTGITIWHKAFLDIIKRYLEGFIFGKCSISEGSEINDYATCYSRQYVIVRGNRQSKYQICPECSAVISQTRPGPEYILERYVGEAMVYQDSQCNFYFTEEVASLFGFKNWEVKECYYSHYIYLQPISLRELPADGQHLPGDG